jgi:hypothetical protein
MSVYSVTFRIFLFNRKSMHTLTPREKKQQAQRRFVLRVCLLLGLIATVTYTAWFAPWARKAPEVRIEVR